MRSQRRIQRLSPTCALSSIRHRVTALVNLSNHRDRPTYLPVAFRLLQERLMGFLVGSTRLHATSGRRALSSI